jgi:hypothetical protein
MSLSLSLSLSLSCSFLSHLSFYLVADPPTGSTAHCSSSAEPTTVFSLSLSLSLSLSTVGYCGFLLCFFSLSQRPVTAWFCFDNFFLFALSFFWFLMMLVGCSTKCLNRIVLGFVVVTIFFFFFCLFFLFLSFLLV